MMDVNGMSPEDAFVEGIRAAMKMTASMGRNGDSELAHVNPEEAAMLEARGGAGTRNPQTGMREYFGSDMGAERGRDSGVGGGGGFGGGGSQREGRSDMSRERGRQTGTRGRTQEGQRSDMSNERGRQSGVSGSPTSAGGPSGPSGDTMNGGDAGDSRSVGERLAAGLEAAFRGPSFGAPTGRDPGILGAAASFAPGIGPMMAGVRGLQAMGLESTADFGDPDADQRDDGILSPSQPVQQQQGQAPVQQGFPWQRPGAQPQAPGGLNFDPAMTPLQQRAAVATGGTNADAGVYRDPAVMDFYRNLATYSLTQPGGAVAPDAQVLPIEQQFVTQLGGQPGDNTESFLRALAGLQR